MKMKWRTVTVTVCGEEDREETLHSTSVYIYTFV